SGLRSAAHALGRSTARSRSAANCSMAALVAAVPVDVRLRHRETRKRRSLLAWAHGARLSLRDTASSNTVGVVRAPFSFVASEGIDARRARRRARRPMVRVWTATPSAPRGHGAGRPPVADLAHRQLRVLQPFDDRA